MEAQLRSTLAFLQSHRAVLNCCLGALLSTDQIGSDEDVAELLDGELANPSRLHESLAELRDFVAEIDKIRASEVRS